jgi:hypothetical protein
MTPTLPTTPPTHHENRERKKKLGTISGLSTATKFQKGAPPPPVPQASSSNEPHKPLTVLTREDVGIPQYSSENVLLYARLEARNTYRVQKPRPIPKKGEGLATSELKRVLKKSAQDTSDYDLQMSDFIMDRIDDSVTKSNFYAIMNGTTSSS